MKVKKVATLLLFFSIPLLFSTCGYNAVDPGICFQNDILPIFVTKCSMQGCHDASSHVAGYNLSTYEGIMQGVKAKHPLQSEVYTSIRGKFASMPPKQKLSDLEVSYIKTWIKIGAPNTSDCSSCDTVDFSYSGRIQPIISSWCLGCHNASLTGGGYDFSTYTGVVDAINSNRFMGSIYQQTGFSAMPKDAAKMSDCSINAIQKWMDAGFPNN